MTGNLNRRQRRAISRAEKRKNNRRSVDGRFIQLAPRYTDEEILAAKTSVERYRRARSLRNIQHHF